MKKIIITLTLICLMAVPLIAKVDFYEVGDQVDDFTLSDHRGDPVSLYNYQDHIVLLTFWETG